MKLWIDPQIFQNNPDFKMGVVIIRGMSNERRNSSLESLLRGICAQKGKEFANKNIHEEKMIQCWDKAYGNFGVNPHKKPCSIAALLKRVASGKEIPHINALVDLYNYFSLKFMMPIGGEDLDWLCGDLRLTYTKGGEPFRAIGSIEVEQAKEGEVAYLDEAGITCRYWNYRECERSKFTNKTTNAVLFVEDMGNTPMDEFGAKLRELQNGVIKYIGGQIETYILNEEQNEVDMGIQGRTGLDDSKVAAQEKAYFEKQHAKKKSKTLKKDSPAKPKVKTKTKPLETESDNLFKNRIARLSEQALAATFPDLKKVEIKIEYPTASEHGDYACNIAMQIAKKVQLPPRDAAQKIVDNFPQNNLIDKIDIAGPGFINFFVSDAALNKLSADIDESYGSSKIGEGKNIIVEFSQPNIAKPLGVHHLLSTIIGQSLYNIYKKLGFNAIGINHIGDWGTQFGKLIYAYKNWGDRKTVEKDPIAEMLKLYVKFHDEAEKDDSLNDAARHEFKIFEEGDKENRELWQWFVDESMKEINGTYKKLGGIHFDHITGESFYEDKMTPILAEGKNKGVFVHGREGAFVAEFEDENIPTAVIQKKDGATLYATRDIATIKYRIEKWKPEKILYVVDIAQTLHFKQVYDICSRFDWYSHGTAEHVWFGRMHLKDGKASTRKGNVVLLNDVLKEAVKRAKELITEKNPGLKNLDEVAEKVGIGAIKYNILSQNRTTDITFDWDRMLSFEGNSAPYLQYTYARAQSILKKVDDDAGEPMVDLEAAEGKTRDLVRLFPKYAEQVALAAKEYKPNIIATFIFDLAQKFNAFYNAVPVLKADDSKKRTQRIQVVKAASQILKDGLSLLLIETVEEM